MLGICRGANPRSVLRRPRNPAFVAGFRAPEDRVPWESLKACQAFSCESNDIRGQRRYRPDPLRFNSPIVFFKALLF